MAGADQFGNKPNRLLASLQFDGRKPEETGVPENGLLATQQECGWSVPFKEPVEPRLENSVVTLILAKTP